VGGPGQLPVAGASGAGTGWCGFCGLDDEIVVDGIDFGL
jgi:hypothetical protein